MSINIVKDGVLATLEGGEVKYNVDNTSFDPKQDIHIYSTFFYNAGKFYDGFKEQDGIFQEITDRGKLMVRIGFEYGLVFDVNKIHTLENLTNEELDSLCNELHRKSFIKNINCNALGLDSESILMSADTLRGQLILYKEGLINFYSPYHRGGKDKPPSFVYGNRRKHGRIVYMGKTDYVDNGMILVSERGAVLYFTYIGEGLGYQVVKLGEERDCYVNEIFIYNRYVAILHVDGVLVNFDIKASRPTPEITGVSTIGGYKVSLLRSYATKNSRKR